MKSQLLTLVALSPLTAYALPRRHRRHNCGGPSSTSTITIGLPLSEIPTFSAVPIESLPAATTTYLTDSITTNTETPTATATAGLLLSDIPSFTAVPAESLPAETYTTYTITPSKEAGYPASPVATATATKVVDGAYAKATEIPFKVAPTKQCGNNDRLILPGMPWTVANSMYNADQMVGKQCTNFDGILETANGTKVVKWTSVTDVELVDKTKDLCKGYTNIGIGVNLKKKLKDIKSIPAYYKWDRTNTTEFRGKCLFCLYFHFYFMSLNSRHDNHLRYILT